VEYESLVSASFQWVPVLVRASLQWEPVFSMIIDRRLHSNLGSQDHVIRLHFSQFIAVASMSKASDIFDCPVTPSQSAEYKKSFEYKERTVEQKTSKI
jgi:hypothetical protein